MVLSKISNFYRGEFSKTFMKKIIIPLTFSLFFVLLLVALLFYPPPYGFTSDAISNLGNPILNPLGWPFFSIAFWFLALMLPSIFIYLHKRLTHLSVNGTRIGTIFNFISVLGMVLLGIFPNLEELTFIHNLAAALSFGGLLAGCVSYWVTMIKEAVIQAVKYRNLTIIAILAMITALFSMILLVGVIQTLHITPLQLEFPFWEWTLFIILTFQLFIFVLIIPEHFSPHS